MSAGDVLDIAGLGQRVADDDTEVLAGDGSEEARHRPSQRKASRERWAVGRASHGRRVYSFGFKRSRKVRIFFTSFVAKLVNLSTGTCTA